MANTQITCSVENCNAPMRTGGWCDKHYKRFLRHDDPLGGVFAGRSKTCEMDGCDRPTSAKGLCSMHNKRKRRHGCPSITLVDKTGGHCIVDGCGAPKIGRGYCSKHYHRVRKYGHPDGRRESKTMWLNRHATYSGDDCLTWPFGYDTTGYGRVDLDGVYSVASRVMCIIAHGEPGDPSLQAAHRCGEGKRGCLNPKHLYWATLSENQLEKAEHGTAYRGKNHHKAKLGPIDVLGIRALSGAMEHRDIGKEFGVSHASVGRILRGQSWRWFT